MRKGATAGVIIGIIVALVVGGVVGYAINGSMNNNSMTNASVSEDHPSTMTKAADLRVSLNRALRQHVALATVALTDAAKGAPETDAAVKALDDNSVAIADMVGSVYGDDARNSFLQLWRDHIGYFVDYTKAKVAGDQAKMDKAIEELKGYTEDASSFFANANPNIDKAALKEGLTKHFNQVIAIVDAYAAKDYTKAFATENEAAHHIGMTADTLSAAIVKQFPEKF